MSVLLALSSVACGSTPAKQADDTAASGPRRYISTDGPTYGSVEALAKEADLVIVGSVGPVVRRAVDAGGEPATDESGIPLELHPVMVESILQGEAGESVSLVLLDSSQVIGDEVISVSEGEVLLLFLVRRDAMSAPGLLSGDEVAYVPIGGSNGVARVDGQVVTTVSGLPVSLDGDPDAPPELATGSGGDQVEVPATFKLSEIVELVESLNGT